MIYVGIDVASDKHDFIIMNENGNMYTKRSVVIPNTNEGYKKLHNSINEFCGVNNDYKVRIGLESTGFYHQNILNYLVNNGFEVMVINPILTNMSKKSKKVHTPKNDNLDAIAICKYLKDPETVFKPYTITSYHSEALKSLSRERFHLIENLSKEKQNIYKLITIIFPEFLALFSNIYQGSAANILTKYPSPKLISRAHLSTLKGLIHGKCKTNAETLQETAKNSIGTSDDYLSFQLTQAFKRLNNMLDEIREYNSKIKEYVLLINPKILSIPGVSYITAGIILGEIGDIKRFKNAEHLISFSGLDIEVYESNKTKATKYHISKKGSKYLRFAFYQVAKVIWRFDSQFAEYYSKKKNEGKHFFVILGHIEKKIVRVVFSVLKNNKDYVIPQKITI